MECIIRRFGSQRLSSALLVAFGVIVNAAVASAQVSASPTASPTSSEVAAPNDQTLAPMHFEGALTPPPPRYLRSPLTQGMRWDSHVSPPPGWTVVRRAQPGRVLGGALMFGIPWTLTAWSVIGSSAGYLAIPIVGPFIGAAEFIAGAGSCSGSFCGLYGVVAFVGAAVLIIDGLLQAAGTVVAIAGLAHGPRTLETDLSQRRMARLQRPHWSVVPVAPGAEVGGSFMVTGF